MLYTREQNFWPIYATCISESRVPLDPGGGAFLWGRPSPGHLTSEPAIFARCSKLILRDSSP